MTEAARLPLEVGVTAYLLAAFELKRIRTRRNARTRKARVRRKYLWLLNALGYECKKCGTLGDLTIDHVNGLDWGVKHSEVCHETRVNLYLREYEHGVPLQILCKRCNSQKGRGSWP